MGTRGIVPNLIKTEARDMLVPKCVWNLVPPLTWSQEHSSCCPVPKFYILLWPSQQCPHGITSLPAMCSHLFLIIFLEGARFRNFVTFLKWHSRKPTVWVFNQVCINYFQTKHAPCSWLTGWTDRIEKHHSGLAWASVDGILGVHAYLCA